MRKTVHYGIYGQLRSSFLILIGLFSFSTIYTQNIDFGKSYINVTKGTNGGTIETGDTLEIRASLVVRAGAYDSCAYYDAVPAGTVYIPGTVRVLTNEGKIYKQFTDAMNDDAGWITGSTIRINLGYNTTDAPATAFRRGRVRNTHKPSFYGSSCIMIASFRVRVTAAIGSTIATGGGSMTYKSGASPISTFNFPNNIVAIYTNYGVCTNAIGVNAIGTEFNGTFGSGPIRNRGTSGNVPPGYTYRVFTNNTPNDYSYGIANNTSAQFGYTTLNTWPKPDPDPDGAGPLTTHRVFSVWDIIGDHTGAADPIIGNPATDTVANNNGGYMLVVNAAYRIDSAFQQTITGLCPNTYYEISCWMRNICSKCGCDSNGKGATNSSGPPYYIPTATGDSSGVRPNITFEVNGVDYYTTGDLVYSGQWVKKGFTYLTGPSETSIVLKFFNNAPGGGGNDWALDDITVATCSPELTLNPSPNPYICESNLVEIGATVYSFFNNYTYYKWQKSTNGGASWFDTGVSGGPVSPTWNGSDWEYTANYPPFIGTLADNGDMYRLVIATTASNLSDSACAFSDPTVITLTVDSCYILETNFISFSAKTVNESAVLTWTTTREEEPIQYIIEKSTDGINFTAIETINSYTNGNDINEYSYTDPEKLNSATYYRIKMFSVSHGYKYSRIILIAAKNKKLSLGKVINPFHNELNMEIISAENTKVRIALINLLGNTVKQYDYTVFPGVYTLSLPGLELLPAGVYTLQLSGNGEVFTKKVMKTQQ